MSGKTFERWYAQENMQPKTRDGNMLPWTSTGKKVTGDMLGKVYNQRQAKKGNKYSVTYVTDLTMKALICLESHTYRG